jgi:phage FluMu protein Com
MLRDMPRKKIIKTLRCSKCGLHAHLDGGSGLYFPKDGTIPVIDGKCPNCEGLMMKVEN